MNRQLPDLPEVTTQKVAGTASEVAGYQTHDAGASVATVTSFERSSPDRSTRAIDSKPADVELRLALRPVHGAAKYHQGIDLQAAYGQEVPAAARGTRGRGRETRGAYGQTVVLEHADGLRTRYAHLSAMDVSVGDRVLQGQEIGRVGQSGRATGPHLHFEVIRDGQRIDPTTVVALQGSGLGGLKLAGAVADSPSRRARTYASHVRSRR